MEQFDDSLCYECQENPRADNDSDLCTQCEMHWQEQIEKFSQAVEEREERRKRHAEMQEFYDTQPQVSGFIIHHVRATDRVFFGPFPTVDDVKKWLSEVGFKYGVQAYIEPVMNPHGDPQDFWWIPDNAPIEELTKPRKERVMP